MKKIKGSFSKIKEKYMNSHLTEAGVPLEYVLLIILIFLVLFTVLSLFWPAIQLFYNANLR